MPVIIHPMLATLVDDPFSNPEWIFETKWDGFRAVCFLQNGRARFISRNQLDMTHQYPELVDVGKQVDAKEATAGARTDDRCDLVSGGPVLPLAERSGEDPRGPDVLPAAG
jgi:hypothetical protein